MVGVAQHGADDGLVHAALAQDGRAVLRVLGERRVDFPVEVVQQAGHAPQVGVFAEFFGVEAHGGLDAQHVAHKVFIFDVFTDEGDGLIVVHGFGARLS